MILESEVIRRLAEYQHNLHPNQLFQLFSILESMASIEVTSTTVEDADIAELREMRLLRPDLDVCLDPVDQASFGTVSDHGNNVAAVTFETKKAVLQRCREFARARGFSIRVAHNSYRAERQEGNAKYSCKMVKGQQPLIPGSTTKCPFFITVYGIRDCWKITKMCLAHDHFRHGGFQGDTFVEGGLANDLSRQRLRDVPYRVMRGVVEREMLPSYSGTWASVTGRSIIDFLMAKGMLTNRTTASQIKRDLLESLRDDVIESYQKLEGYLAMVSDANPPTAFGFQKHENGLFSRACVFPGACLQAMQHCKHVIGLDGTHLKGDMNKRGVFLLATTKDLEGHLLVFGIALVAQEDYSNWSWFLGNLKAAMDAVSSWKPAFVSDRQKGLLASVTELFPDSGHRFCVRHIITNIAKKGSSLTPAEQALVFRMARSECENDYKFFSSQLSETRPLAVEYLNGIDKAHWVTYAFSETYNQPSYDEVTSNLSEAANNWLGNSCRSSYPLQAFEQYFVKVVELFAERRHTASRRAGVRGSDDRTPSEASSEATSNMTNYDFNKILLPVYKKKLDGMMALTKSLHILPCLDGQYMVRFTDISSRPDHAHLWRTVNLIEKECSCRHWQDEKFPCVHAVKAAIHHGIHVSELFAWREHSVLASRSTHYYQFVPPVRSASIPQDHQLIVPELIVNEADQGKRGKKPGPKPKHKRRSARAGSAASVTVAMTQ